MKTRPVAIAAVLATLAAANGIAHAHKPLAMKTAVDTHRRTPVLVELFTSEGCNSCPPANRLLTELTRDQSVAGAYIIPLGEHVDYFNTPWVDPFSAHRYTERQSAYAKSFHLDEVYTPEMIVDGRHEFIGSDRSAATTAIAEAAGKPHATVDVATGPTSDRDRITIEVKVSAVPSIASAPYVFVAVTEDDLVSDVKSGENAGAHLAHSAVVRELIRVRPVKGGQGQFRQSITLKSGWDRAHLHAVAFVQDIDTGTILGAGLADITHA